MAGIDIAKSMMIAREDLNTVLSLVIEMWI